MADGTTKCQYWLLHIRSHCAVDSRDSFVVHLYPVAQCHEQPNAKVGCNIPVI